MNTREREEVLKVMDALANALRTADSLLDSANIGGGAQENMEALAAYDALLAEGSASSEGAVAWRRESLGDFASPHDLTSDVTIAAVWAKRYNVTPLYTHPQPAQGEHEQRSCEGSERRPIARNEVSAIADEVVERMCQEHNRNSVLDERACPSGMRAALESALPRGLPAGSDAGTTGEMTPRRATYFMERFKRDEKMLGPNEQKALDYVIAMLATAEQPSCGQDARDAARYRFLRMMNERDDDGSPCIQIAEVYPDFTNYPAGDKFDEAVDTFMSIAAQQRQGGTK